MATYYVRTDGDNGASGLNNTNDPSTGAWADLGYAATQIASNDIVYVKSGSYTFSTSTPGAGGPIVPGANVKALVEGFDSSPGDFGTPPVISAGAVTSVTMFQCNQAVGSVKFVLRNIILDGNSGSGNNGVGGSQLYMRCDKVVARNFDAATSNYGFLTPVDLYLCTADSCGIGFSGENKHLSKCLATGCTNYGFDLRNSHNLCIADSNAIGFYNNGGNSAQKSVGCIAYGNTSHGFSDTAAKVLECCVAVGNGGYGIGGTGATILNNVYGYNNTSGNVQTTPFSGSVTALTADPFVDAANGDFNINNTAGGGAVLRAATVTR